MSAAGFVRFCCEGQEKTDRRRGNRRSVLARAKATRVSPFYIIRISILRVRR